MDKNNFVLMQEYTVQYPINSSEYNQNYSYLTIGLSELYPNKGFYFLTNPEGKISLSKEIENRGHFSDSKVGKEYLFAFVPGDSKSKEAFLGSKISNNGVYLAIIKIVE